MRGLHVKNGFVGLAPVNHSGWSLFDVGHKYSPFNCPFDQLAVLWRHGRTAEKNIGMTWLDFAFSNPAKLDNTLYFSHIGTYRTKNNASRAQYQVKRSDQYHSKLSHTTLPKFTSAT